MYALKASTGAKGWSYATGGAVQSSPAVADGLVYFSSYDGNIYAVETRTGFKLWSYPAFGTSSAPAVANGVVYVAPSDFYQGNSLYALNASTGALLWSYPLGFGLSW